MYIVRRGQTPTSGQTPILRFSKATNEIIRQLSKGFLECFALVVDNLRSTGDLIQAYTLYAGAYDNKEYMQKQLVSSYITILDFWREASRLFERKGEFYCFLGRSTNNR